MNNRNLLMVFFGLACLVLLVGVFTASTTLPDGTRGNNGMSPQQINQTLPNTTTPQTATDTNNITNAITEQPKDQQLPTEMDPNKMGQDISNGMQTTEDAMKNMIPDMNAQ